MKALLARAWNGARFGLDLGRAAIAGVAAARGTRGAPAAPANPAAPMPVHMLLEADPEHGLSPAARYRAVQYAPLLRQHGFDCRLLPSRPGKYWSAAAGFQQLQRRWPRVAGAYALWQHARMAHNRRRDFRALDGGVVFLQRDLVAGPRSRLEREIPLWNRHVVFDFDDAIWAQPPWVRADAALQLAQQEKLAGLCQLAAVVLAANDHLAAFARRHCARVHVLPTTLCTDEFAPAVAGAPRAPSLRPVVGWAGTSGNLYYLRQLAPALRALAQRAPFTLRIVCNRVAPDELGALRELPQDTLEVVEWNARDEVRRLQQFDVGIMPLDDDDWARGKAGFKMLQYMACGVPFVASPVGANPVVGGGDGECGLYATTSDDWVDRLGAMLLAPARRARLGAAGRARAVAKFDRRVHVPTLAAALREAADA